MATHGQWSSRFAFIMAATGSAVGLGNIWKFPYMAGENGGGAFVLVYLLCVLAIGLPLMMAEVLMGRQGRLSPIGSFRVLAQRNALGSQWRLVGVMGVLAGLLILSFYSVVAGWAMQYAGYAASGALQGLGSVEVNGLFGQLLADKERLLALHTGFIVLTLLIVAGGVERGLEKAVIVLMPALFLMLVGLVIYAAVNGAFATAVSFIFEVNVSKITPSVVLAAMGQAFFSLSLGMGAIMVYGAYLPANASIPRVVGIVVLADTLVALIAGLAVFPIVFANNLEPAAGPGLVFQTLPLAFSQMPFGSVVGTVFFVLLVVAALTSAISLLEPAVAWAIERTQYGRKTATLVFGLFIWVLGLGTVLSFNDWADMTFLGRTFFDNLDALTSNIMLPLGGLFIAIFVAWRMLPADAAQELGWEHGKLFSIWKCILAYVVPVVILLILLQSTGLLEQLLDLVS